MRHGSQALLTLCAGGELYYARRLDWDDTGLLPSTPVLPAVPDMMEDLDFIDYGAADGSTDTHGAPRLVVEVQRSLDLWERSWPDLPMAGLWVQAGAASDALAAQLEPALGIPVHRLEPDALFPGFATVAPDAALREALLPLISALQRDATV